MKGLNPPTGGATTRPERGPREPRPQPRAPGAPPPGPRADAAAADARLRAHHPGFAPGALRWACGSLLCRWCATAWTHARGVPLCGDAERRHGPRVGACGLRNGHLGLCNPLPLPPPPPRPAPEMAPAWPTSAAAPPHPAPAAPENLMRGHRVQGVCRTPPGARPSPAGAPVAAQGTRVKEPGGSLP